MMGKKLAVDDWTINDILELDNLDGEECEKLLVSLEIERMKNNKSSEKQ